jgi:hypothetical protein
MTKMATAAPAIRVWESNSTAYQKNKNDLRHCFGTIENVFRAMPDDYRRDKRGLNLVLRFFTP